jgi:hypothetical protein
MTDKAQAVLQKMTRRGHFRNPKAKGRVLDDFNRSTLYDVIPLEADQSMALLKDMNELEQTIR